MNIIVIFHWICIGLVCVCLYIVLLPPRSIWVCLDFRRTLFNFGEEAGHPYRISQYIKIIANFIQISMSKDIKQLQACPKSELTQIRLIRNYFCLSWIPGQLNLNRWCYQVRLFRFGKFILNKWFPWCIHSYTKLIFIWMYGSQLWFWEELIALLLHV